MSERSNIVSDYINRIAQQQSKVYHKFLRDCFKKFGITKENANDFVGRMEYDVEYSYFDEPYSIVRHRYFLDGKYLFTVEEKQEILKDKINYSLRAIEGEKGMKNELQI